MQNLLQCSLENTLDTLMNFAKSRGIIVLDMKDIVTIIDWIDAHPQILLQLQKASRQQSTRFDRDFKSWIKILGYDNQPVATKD